MSRVFKCEHLIRPREGYPGFIECIDKIDPVVKTRRYMDVDSTFFERYGRQMDVKTKLCAYTGRMKEPLKKLQNLIDILCIKRLGDL